MLGGSHPFRLQVAGSSLYDAILDKRSQEERYDMANDLFYQRSAYHYDEVWGNLDKNTQTILLMLFLRNWVDMPSEKTLHLVILKR